MSEKQQSLTLETTFVFQGVLLTPGDLIVFTVNDYEIRAAFLQVEPGEILATSKNAANPSDLYNRYPESSVSALRVELPAAEAVPQEAQGMSRGQRLRGKTPSTGLVEGTLLAAFKGTIYMWSDCIKTLSKKQLLGDSSNAKPETTNGFVRGSIMFFERL